MFHAGAFFAYKRKAASVWARCARSFTAHERRAAGADAMRRMSGAPLRRAALRAFWVVESTFNFDKSRPKPAKSSGVQAGAFSTCKAVCVRAVKLRRRFEVNKPARGGRRYFAA